MKHFTTYWRNSTWNYNQKALDENLLEHTASENFRRRVQLGDAVYVVTILKGKLYVACKIIVDQICDKRRAASLLGKTDLWDATDHIIASSSTRIDWSRMIPEHITRKLEFHSPDGKTKIKLRFKSIGNLDTQTLRGTRTLTEASAALLDDFLGELVPISKETPVDASKWDAKEDPEKITDEFESAAEGALGKRYVRYYERNKANRDQAIRVHGLTCKACEMNFEKTYGIHGKDFIHVHHTVPVSQFEAARKVDIEKEMTVLCPNCHAMVHRNKKRTLSVLEVRTLLKRE